MSSIILCISVDSIIAFAYDNFIAIATLIVAIVTLIKAKKALYANTISNSRPAYISSLRIAFAKLHSALCTENFREISEGISLVKYHLNEDDKIKGKPFIDVPFIEECLNIFKYKENDKNDPKDIEYYRMWSAAILLYEWESFKMEIAKGGGLSEKQKQKQKQKYIDPVKTKIDDQKRKV